ncbi:MAG: YihY/virulence factor BrkB family protein [Azonexus sp.]
MPHPTTPARQIITHPLSFALQVLRGFQRNQGLLLAGAIAYYALLSVLPLLILSIIALSHFIDQAVLLETVGRYLEWLVPSQSQAVLADVSAFLANRGTIGVVLLASLLFFSSLAFSVLEKAMAIIFVHRGVARPRHFLISAALPYCFVLLLGLALLAVTMASVILQAMAEGSIHLFGHDWALSGLSGLLLYLLGLLMETVVLSALYLIAPVGRMQVSHALLGGFSAAMLWEILRHVLIWYFATLSKASVVYGSLTTAVVVLFSMELAATLVLLGAQVIAEYERQGAGQDHWSGAKS